MLVSAARACLEEHGDSITAKGGLQRYVNN